MAGPLRGYANWKPTDDVLYWLGQVERVLGEYEDYLPLSLRQVFYSLTDVGFEKSERAYGRLVTWVARARRAQLLPFDAFSDAQGRPRKVLAYGAGPEDFWAAVRKNLRHYRRDRLRPQAIRVEVWTEATGIGEQLERVAWQYGIPVYISRGYASVTNVYDLADRALGFDGHTVVLHVGDFDPSGVGLYESLRDDSRAFLLQRRGFKEDLAREDGQIYFEDAEKEGPWLRFERVALTAEQVEEYEVTTAPPKKADSRSASWVGETAQAEALPPDLLARLVTDAVEAELDMDLYEETVDAEEADRAAIAEVLEDV